MNKSDNKPKIECNHEYEKRPEDVGITCKHCWLLKTTIERKEMENQTKETTEDIESNFRKAVRKKFGRNAFSEEVMQFFEAKIVQAKEQERERIIKIIKKEEEHIKSVTLEGEYSQGLLVIHDILSELEEVKEEV